MTIPTEVFSDMDLASEDINNQDDQDESKSECQSESDLKWKEVCDIYSLDPSGDFIFRALGAFRPRERACPPLARVDPLLSVQMAPLLRAWTIDRELSS